MSPELRRNSDWWTAGIPGSRRVSAVKAARQPGTNPDAQWLFLAWSGGTVRGKASRDQGTVSQSVRT